MLTTLRCYGVYQTYEGQLVCRRRDETKRPFARMLTNLIAEPYDVVHLGQAFDVG